MGRFLILKLEGVDDLQAAERLRGWQLTVPRDKLPPLPENQYYSFQLLGMTVVTEGGEVIGELHEILPMPAHDIYRVMGKKGEVLIPAVKEIVAEIDLIRGRMVVRPPAGLLE
jgi:16S rRNA processing protein RimM